MDEITELGAEELKIVADIGNGCTCTEVVTKYNCGHSSTRMPVLSI